MDTPTPSPTSGQSEGSLTAFDPASGRELGSVPASTEAKVNAACTAAGKLFRSLSPFPTETGVPPNRALLYALAEALTERAGSVVSLADRETALGGGRLSGELARTAFQLRAQADIIDTPLLRQPLADQADPQRVPPLSAQRRLNIAIGPVAVFAASNFPLAFGVLGGDTASALAAGCPVVVKAHPAHPRTGELLASIVADAIGRSGVDPAWLQVVHGDGPNIGGWLVLHPDIAAVGFTGSTGGGMALKRLADSRPVPIPVYAEMGSVNPAFVGPHAAATRAREIGVSWAAVLSTNAGQLCTKPGILVAPNDVAAAEISQAAVTALAELDTPPLLAPRLASGYRHRVNEVQAIPEASVTVLPSVDQTGSFVPAVVVTADETALIARPTLSEEVFGPAGLVVATEDPVAYAERLVGNLTAALIVDAEDADWAAPLIPALARKVGRIAYDKWPTGVSVGLATVHGGPFPATAAPATTSVGSTAAWRFLRPVGFDGFPEEALPDTVRALIDADPSR